MRQEELRETGALAAMPSHSHSVRGRRGVVTAPQLRDEPQQQVPVLWRTPRKAKAPCTEATAGSPPGLA